MINYTSRLYCTLWWQKSDSLIVQHWLCSVFNARRLIGEVKRDKLDILFVLTSSLTYVVVVVVEVAEV